jgi:hypothetical protein
MYPPSCLTLSRSWPYTAASPCSMPSTSALVNAPLFHTLLSNDASLPCKEAKATMPPLSADVMVFISLSTST